MTVKRNLYIRTITILFALVILTTLALSIYSFVMLRNIERALIERTRSFEPTIEEPIVEEPIVEEPIVEEPVVEEPVVEEPATIEETIIHISSLYENVEPALVMSVIFHESRFDPNAKNGSCLGLMQVSTRWHYDRADRLGVEDFFDPYGNILLGVDYLDELIERHKDPALALMMYNMKHDTARRLYSQGTISTYARSVLELSESKYESVVTSWQ